MPGARRGSRRRVWRPGSRRGGGVKLSAVATTAKLTIASLRSAAYTPWATYAGSVSKRTVSPPCSSGRNRLCSAITSARSSSSLVVEGEQVPLDAEVPEQRRRRPEREIVHAAGGVRSLGPDVGAHQLRRDEHRRAALDRLALERVVAVAGPHRARCGEGSRGRCARRPTSSDSISTRGWRARELVEQPVERQRLGVGAGGAIRRRCAAMWSRFMSHLT